MEIVQLPHLQNHPLQIALFKNVKNASFLRQQLLEGNSEYGYAFLDASVLLSRHHVFAACFRAINDSVHGRLKSKNVHSEIVFALSPNNNIAESFRRFGVSETTTSIVAIKVGVDAATIEQHLKQVVEGELVPFTDGELASMRDNAAIKNAYKVESFDKEAEPYVVGMIALKGS